MTKPIQSAGEAMPPAKPQSELVARAMLGLELDVLELMFMAGIAADHWRDLPGPIASDDQSVTFQFTKLDTYKLNYLIGRVAGLASQLQLKFDAASAGEKLP